ncbi:hypothetical protein BG011_000357 [Mortierella polycephala]|uniref:Prolactin regulatory element-binding protein n=1 Tax=Mortierella polycephala TaxID=41804 RepID=A0A9P6U6S2_9FUNG|nr:hypothetical protein BG011_000357 [Mortierella polycephala]
MTHFTATVGIPIFCVGFTLDDNLILAGGGGAGRNGVKNKISIYRVDTTKKSLTQIVERELNRDEDAPMSISVHPKEKAMAFGINSAVNKIKAGENENCRKVTRFNKDGTLLATGGTDGVISLLKYPALTPVFPATQFKGHEILDLDFSADGAYLSAVSTQNLWIISTENGRVLELITNPVLNKKKPFEFRTCRFGRGAFVSILYTVVNGEKNRKPFVCMWDTSNWTRIRTLAVGPRPITACAMSNDGRLIAFGSSDMGIRICSSKTLQVLMTIPKVHALPIPSLAFNNDASLLVSASVDATCSVISVPKTFPKNNNFVMLVLALLFLFMAALIQVYQNAEK